MWTKIGLQFNPDANSGNPFGFGEYTENWKKGSRQPAGQAYGLAGVHVMTESPVRKVLLEDAGSSGIKATGIELVDGRAIRANEEVILSCGAMKTPQILMISGIGPRDTLSKIGVPQHVDAPDVGLNFHDHPACIQFWKLRDPDQGLALGHPKFNKPEYQHGLPTEWLVTESAPKADVEKAMEADGLKLDPKHPHMALPRADIETLMAYAPLGSVPGFQVPFDGSHVATAAICLLPTSRGSLTIDSADPLAMPIIDPNYYGTEADRVVLRHAMRMNMRAVETAEGQSFIECETPPEGYPTITSTSSDAELDKRIMNFGGTWWHPAGTASMGTVVDTKCNVKGVKSLRVVDASILPVPLSAHYQAPMYAVAESTADLIVGEAHVDAEIER